MKDERNDHRIFLLFYLEIYCCDTDKFMGSVTDLSSSGMRICCKNPLEMGSDLNCKMTLPAPPMDCQDLEFKAEVIWCEKAFNPNYYDIGTQFKDLSQSQQEIIDKLIEVTIYDHCWPSENQCFPMEY